MASLFGEVRARFDIVGDVVDHRILTSPKQPDWKGYILKVAGRGCMLEITVTQEQYEETVLNNPYHIAGDIMQESTRTKLIPDLIKRLAMPKESA